MMNKYTLPAILGILLVSGCNSGDNTTSNTADTRSGGTLKIASDESLTDYFRNALTTENTPASAGQDMQVGDASVAPTEASSTTLQEAGVDEDDRIKFHAGHDVLYALYNRNTAGLPQGLEHGLRSLKLKAGGEAEEIQRIPNDSDANDLGGIYLFEDQNRLATLGSINQNIWFDWFYPIRFGNQTTQLKLFTIESDGLLNTTPTILDFDGTLIASRSVGNVMYLVLRHYPDFSVLRPETLQATDVLPDYTDGTNTTRKLVDPSACYLNAESKSYRADIITLVAIDITHQTPAINSVCHVGATETLYASTEALYLATTDWEYDIVADDAMYPDPRITTDVHKFAFKGTEFEYRGSAEVGGHLGWHQNRKPFRFSESGGHLRVITYNEQRPWLALPAATARADADESSPAMLTILKESDSVKALETVSTLPNKNRPAPLGKEGEQLYATRYVGDRAYLVTFRVVDPLYVLSLSDPADPYIEGELEIDGYSDYLYPVGENLLLGIGKDAIPDSGATDFRPGAWYQGVKLSLIDVSSPSNPQEVDKVIIGKRGTESAALQNHHAYTQLDMNNGKVRIALPVELHDTNTTGTGEPFDWWDYIHTGLYSYEIDQTTKSIQPISPLVVASRDEGVTYNSTHNDRSRIIGDNVYYLHKDSIWSQDWEGNTAAQGPM